MSEMRVVKMTDISATMNASTAFFQETLKAVEKYGNDKYGQKLGPISAALIFMQQQAMNSLEKPYFEPTAENVAIHFDYMSAVGFCMSVLPLVPEEILMAAADSADVAPWFHEAIQKPAVAGQPLWPTITRHLMIEQIQAIHFAKALIEELTVRIPEIMEA